MLSFFKKVLKGEKGYTLIEVAAVVAITATLTGVIMPVAMDKVAAGKAAGALGDVNSLAGAITSFYKDTGEWPARSGTSANFFNVLRTGTTVNDDPGFDSVKAPNWAVNYEVIDDLEGHLEKDLPDGTAAYLTNKVNWNGPYLSGLGKKLDPWNHNYLVNVKAMHTKTFGLSTGEATNSDMGTAEFGWILSAGPNGKIETDTRVNSLGGDDIGAWFNTQHGRQ